MNKLTKYVCLKWFAGTSGRLGEFWVDLGSFGKIRLIRGVLGRFGLIQGVLGRFGEIRVDSVSFG